MQLSCERTYKEERDFSVGYFWRQFFFLKMCKIYCRTIFLFHPTGGIAVVSFQHFLLEVLHELPSFYNLEEQMGSIHLQDTKAFYIQSWRGLLDSKLPYDLSMNMNHSCSFWIIKLAKQDMFHEQENTNWSLRPDSKRKKRKKEKIKFPLSLSR